jgi:hypothetical protein
MNIALFADVHGRVQLCFALCARWQRETGERIDLILQCGDLGAFPDPARLDRATLRYAQRDPSELGFAQHFTQVQPEVAAVLAETTCPLVFVRGNHEDHAWLDRLEAQTDAALFAVDAYQRVWCLKTGVPYTHRVGDETLTILGVGRIGPKDARKAARAQYIQPAERARLHHLGNLDLDILLTHDSAQDFVTRGYGMADIRLLLDRYRPCYHFYGHTGKPLDLRVDTNGVTTSCKLTDLHWDTRAPDQLLEPGGMGILRWHNRADQRFEVVDAAWWREYTAYGWLDG